MEANDHNEKSPRETAELDRMSLLVEAFGRTASAGEKGSRRGRFVDRINLVPIIATGVLGLVLYSVVRVFLA